MSRTTFFEVEILDTETKEQLCFLDKVEPHSSIGDIKIFFHKSYPKWYPARQALRLDPKGNTLRDEDVLQNLPVGTSATMYFRDLGPQLRWTMVFLAEYMGPLLVYLLFYIRVPYIYSKKYAFTSSPHHVVSLACTCHTFHYIKRLFETIFVHRFSHGTMPLRTIVRNCAYYWGFAAWLAYYINHPLYTPPSYGDAQVNYALIVFVLCEAGPKCRKFPHPSKNPFTWLFFFVSCPNYTYEVGAWVGLSIMTQCVPVALFTFVGFIQMTIWAKGKHKTYTREFKDYPNLRMPILPFIL
ncbi:very-long-chain enoyl-CoA reductase isoform X2 [Myxocyprinus asiaticus]|uniref:very-long-chain enoyl-CoA reductase isoform X2 n=1 Tax=Myxocyprinus asiaticus TaxID=70543 RepID=UPI002221837B|nr:very-long-chain enoyl-CoA reductase isoform X2 [Myxocyprinus asiaticus]